MDEMIMWSPGITLDAIEKQAILKAFRFYRGNKTATAQSLGISIRTLDSKLERYEVDGKAEKERHAHEAARRSEFLARSRGDVPNNIHGAALAKSSARPERVHGTVANVRVESPSQPTPQSTVPLPERNQIQSVLPAKTTQGHPKKSR